MITREREIRWIWFSHYYLFVIWKLYYSVSFVISHCVPNLSRLAMPRRLTRGKFDRTKVCAPNIEIQETSANARGRFFGFDDFEVPGVAERTSTRKALFANRSLSSFVYSHRILSAVRAYNASRVTWPCGFVEMFFRALQCNASVRGDCHTTRAMLNFQTNRLDVCVLKLSVILARKSNQND